MYVVEFLKEANLPLLQSIVANTIQNLAHFNSGSIKSCICCFSTFFFLHVSSLCNSNVAMVVKVHLASNHAESLREPA